MDRLSWSRGRSQPRKSCSRTPCLHRVRSLVSCAARVNTVVRLSALTLTPERRPCDVRRTGVASRDAGTRRASLLENFMDRGVRWKESRQRPGGPMATHSRLVSRTSDPLDVPFKQLTVRSLHSRGVTSPASDAIERVRGEFVEMRGFSPTLQQAARLFHLPAGRVFASARHAVERRLHPPDDRRTIPADY